MHEHRHGELGGERGDALDAGGIAGDVELLLADAEGAGLELAADALDGVGLVGDLVGEPGETVGIFFGESLGLRVGIHAGFEAEAGAGGEQNGEGDANGGLVSHHFFGGAAAVGNVLVDIDDWLGRGRGGIFFGGGETGAGEGGGTEQRGGGGEEIAAGSGGMGFGGGEEGGGGS